jgi:hypothetical protein
VSTRSRPLPAVTMLVGLAPALATGLAPGQLHANDRDLRAITVPAAICVGGNPDNFDPGMGITVGNWLPPATATEMRIRCALPLNNVDLGGTSNDNDMTSFTVFYADSDGFGTRTGVLVTLFEVRLSNGRMAGADKCGWDSNHDGTGSTGFTSDNVLCAVDLAATAFYHFSVYIYVNGAPQNAPDAAFSGIRFP